MVTKLNTAAVTSLAVALIATLGIVAGCGIFKPAHTRPWEERRAEWLKTNNPEPTITVSPDGKTEPTITVSPDGKTEPTITVIPDGKTKTYQKKELMRSGDTITVELEGLAPTTHKTYQITAKNKGDYVNLFIRNNVKKGDDGWFEGEYEVPVAESLAKELGLPVSEVTASSAIWGLEYKPNKTRGKFICSITPEGDIELCIISETTTSEKMSPMVHPPVFITTNIGAAVRIESPNFAGKSITDPKDIATIAGLLDFGDRRREPCWCHGDTFYFYLTGGTKTQINIGGHGWNYVGEKGNFRLLKNPDTDTHMSVIRNLFEKKESGQIEPKVADGKRADAKFSDGFLTIGAAVRIESPDFAGKSITDPKDIATIAGLLDFGDKRRESCKCDGYTLDFIFANGTKTQVNIDSHGWNYIGEKGNFRLLKNPDTDTHMSVIRNLFKKKESGQIEPKQADGKRADAKFPDGFLNIEAAVRIESPNFAGKSITDPYGGPVLAEEKETAKSNKEKPAPKEEPTEETKITPELKTKIEELIKKLGDEEWRVRKEATKTLIVLGKPTIESVKKALNDSNAEVRFRAQLVLRGIRYLEVFSDKVCKKIPNLISGLVNYLEGKDYYPLELEEHWLSLIGEAWENNPALLTDSERKMLALEILEEKELIQKILRKETGQAEEWWFWVEAIDNTDDKLRRRAADNLSPSYHRGKGSREPLKLNQEQQEKVANILLSQFESAGLKHEEGIHLLGWLLRQGLGQHKSEIALQMVKRLFNNLESNKAKVRYYSILALTALGFGPLEKEQRIGFLKALLVRMEDEDVEVRRVAVSAWHGVPSGYSPQDEQEKMMVKEIITALLKRIEEEKDEEVCAQAIGDLTMAFNCSYITFGVENIETFVETLLKHMEDKELKIFLTPIMEALRVMAPKLENQKLKGKVIKTLLAKMKANNEEVRKETVITLGRYCYFLETKGQTQVAQTLLGAVTDTDAKVRWAAYCSLCSVPGWNKLKEEQAEEIVRTIMAFEKKAEKRPQSKDHLVQREAHLDWQSQEAGIRKDLTQIEDKNTSNIKRWAAIRSVLSHTNYIRPRDKQLIRSAIELLQTLTQDQKDYLRDEAERVIKELQNILE